MSLFDIFRPKTQQAKEQPSVKWVNIEWFLLNFDLSFEAFYKFFELNPFVAVCVNKKWNDIFSKWFEVRKGNWKTLYNEEFEALIKNSTTQNTRQFFKRMIRDYELTGNVFIYIKRNEQGTPIWLQILDPRYIKPIANKQWIVLWYVQNLDKIKVFLTNEVFHLKDNQNLTNEIMGNSKMTSLFIDLETEKEARESNLAFFINNQTPSSLIIVDENFKIEWNSLIEMKSKIKKLFEGGQFAWWKNKHRSLLTQWIKDVKKIQDKIDDMQFLALRQFTREIVFWIFEVPLSVWWITESTNYSNWLTQYDIYWDNMESLWDVFAEFLTSILKVFDEKYEFVGLKDTLRKLLLKSNIAWYLYKDKWLITLNEAREIIQYEKIDWWDETFKVTTNTWKDSWTEDEEKNK